MRSEQFFCFCILNIILQKHTFICKHTVNLYNYIYNSYFFCIGSINEKIKTLSPEKAQTGPAVRNDDKTIENHLELLEKKQQLIYKLITQSIKNGN